MRSRPTRSTTSPTTSPMTSVAAADRPSTPAAGLRTRVTKLAVLLALVVTAGAQSGCFLPIYSPEPDIRVRQLINVSEGYRHIPNIWERIWGLDMPDVATPYRTHGGVI